MEAHGSDLIGAHDRVKQATRIETDRPIALRQMMMACRNGGTLSVAGVSGGYIDKVPFDSVMNRSLTIRTGQIHVQRHMRPLLAHIQNGEIDPSFIVTHRMSLADAPRAHQMFRDKQDECAKVALTP